MGLLRVVVENVSLGAAPILVVFLDFRSFCTLWLVRGSGGVNFEDWLPRITYHNALSAP